MKVFSRREALLVGLSAVAFGAIGCKKGEPQGAESSAGRSGEGGQAAGGGATPSAGAGSVALTGAGASFPAPLYSRWFQDFSRQSASIRVNYQATGSGAGVRSFSDGQTDFGASDAAMSDDELKAAGFDVLMLPLTAGSIVLAYNLEGVGALKLSRDVYAAIFLGEITNWNDPRIKADNPGVALPDQKITVVRRSDGSGTTYVFTSHLAAISPKWKSGPGAGTSVEWPVGVGGRKNDGIAGLLKQTPGAIGYVEYGYAASTQLPMATLQNKAGKFVSATAESAAAALAAVQLPDDFRAWAPDPEGDGAYPIVTYTWLLLRKRYTDPAKGAAVKKLVEYCLTEGQKVSTELHYVPLPEPVVAKARQALASIQ